jgi:hypothetical protein
MTLLQIMVIIWIIAWTMLTLIIYFKGIKTDNIYIKRHYKKFCIMFLVTHFLISSVGVRFLIFI